MGPIWTRVAALFSFSLICLTPPAQAAQTIKLLPAYGVGGASRKGCWIPITVEIHYSAVGAEEAFEAELRLHAWSPGKAPPEAAGMPSSWLWVPGSEPESSSTEPS